VRDLFGETIPTDGRILSRKFLWPPLTILDTRHGAWQARKREWLSLGIRSELGRSDGLTYQNRGCLAGDAGTSVFDPVLCELVYRWWGPRPGGLVLDPFAGGSVRGIVAHRLGLRYRGIDLSEAQVEANREQARAICRPEDGPLPEWIVGDARDLRQWVRPGEADLVFTCPPYVDLERYSDDPRDLSTLSWTDFAVSYAEIIRASLEALADDRFAVVVVGDARDRATRALYGFVPYAVRAFQFGGASYYTDGILLNPVWNQARRASFFWTRGGRILARCHQHLIVAVKGDPDRAEANARPLDGDWERVFGAPEPPGEEAGPASGGLSDDLWGPPAASEPQPQPEPEASDQLALW